MKCKLLILVTIVACVLLLSIPVYACNGGGGGGGGGGGSDGSDASANETNKSPEGFDAATAVSIDPTLNEFVDMELDSDTGSTGTENPTRSVEDQIALDQQQREEEAAERERTRPRTNMEIAAMANAYQQYLNSVQEGLGDQQRNRYNSVEMVTVKWVRDTRSQAYQTDDPDKRAELMNAANQVMERVNQTRQVRIETREAQLQRTMEDAKWTYSLLAGIGVNIAGGFAARAGYAGTAFVANVAWNAATGGKEGAATSVGATAVGAAVDAAIPGSTATVTTTRVVVNALRDAAVQEGMTRANQARNK